ncbi:MAG: hypothetical protein HQK59_00920 [Deltaproteobacteria bacterium]|nr:hypothetical protein [Deltaproteobacteria bacterium]
MSKIKKRPLHKENAAKSISIPQINNIDQTKIIDQPRTEDKDIVKEILNGASLRTFMIPDPAMPSNFPEHWECYDLPHVIANGNLFWAKSRNEHGTYVTGQLTSQSFCYTNMGSIFLSFNMFAAAIGVMPKSRYKEHRFIPIKNLKLIWDSDKKESPETVVQEIESGSRFRVAFFDSEGIWNIHPVDLPTYCPSSKQFMLNTACDMYPLFFRSIQETGTLEKQVVDGLAKADSPNGGRGCVEVTNMRRFISRYSLLSDGRYQSHSDSLKGTFQEYERLKVFVEE